jgi:hypothetical protein
VFGQEVAATQRPHPPIGRTAPSQRHGRVPPSTRQISAPCGLGGWDATGIDANVRLVSTTGLVLATLAPIVLVAVLTWWMLSLAYRRRGADDHKLRALVATGVIIAVCSVPLLVGSLARVISN